MKRRLIVLDGAPGSGKTTALELAATLAVTEVRIHPKYRTGGRPLPADAFAADYVRLDAESFEQVAASPDFLGYQFGCDRYGIRLNELEETIATTTTTLVVIRSSKVMQALLEQVRSAEVIPVLLSASPDLIERRVAQEQQDAAISRRRLSRTAEYATDLNPALYHQVLVNDGSREDLIAMVHELVNPASKAA